MYPYFKALHIVFVVTWFAGLFYMPRLLIYNTEAGIRDENSCKVLREQFGIMLKRLWYGITWPSAILTLALGSTVLFHPSFQWYTLVGTEDGLWLTIKLGFVVVLYLYHFSLQYLVNQQIKGIFSYTSNQLRIWNEVATILLIGIVMLVVVKQAISLFWGLFGLVLLMLVLLLAIRGYKKLREGNTGQRT